MSSPSEQELEDKIYEKLVRDFRNSEEPDAENRIPNLVNSSDGDYVNAIGNFYDEMLKELLMTHLLREFKYGAKPLGSYLDDFIRDFHHRHELCYALSLIGQETRNALFRIRVIKNRRSHKEFFKITVDDANALRSVCPTLRERINNATSVVPLANDHQEFKKMSAQRLQFMDVCTQVTGVLQHSIACVSSGLSFIRY